MQVVQKITPIVSITVLLIFYSEGSAPKQGRKIKASSASSQSGTPFTKKGQNILVISAHMGVKPQSDSVSHLSSLSKSSQEIVPPSELPVSQLLSSPFKSPEHVPPQFQSPEHVLSPVHFPQYVPSPFSVSFSSLLSPISDLSGHHSNSTGMCC